KTKESLILEQLEKEVVFKNEAQTLNDLEGKGSTGHLDSSLSGATESTSSGTNYWKNKNSYENETGKGNLSGKIDPNKQDLPVDGFYRGHDKGPTETEK